MKKKIAQKPGRFPYNETILCIYVNDFIFMRKKRWVIFDVDSECFKTPTKKKY